MPYSVVRFNCIQPGLEPEAMGQRYQAFVEMAGYADEHELQAISLEEHHGAENGWSPSPLVMAGLVFGRTQKIMATINALLVPLHDPLRIAEDIAVLDLASGGRLIVTGGIGYRRERVRRPREGLVEARRAAGRGDRRHAQGVDRRAVRVPRDDGAGDAPSVHATAPRAHAGRVEQGRGAPGGALRAALHAARQHARAGGVLLRAVRRSRARRASARCRRSTPR